MGGVNSTYIPIVSNVNCTLSNEEGPKCFHFRVCDPLTRNCGCASVPYSLCSQPFWSVDAELKANFLAIKGELFYPSFFTCVIVLVPSQGVIFSLQIIVVLISVALLIDHTWKRGKFFAKPTREQAALIMVLCCAVTNIMYTALDPNWTQLNSTQAVEALVYWLGDLFVAFLAAGYGLMAGMWLSIQLSTPQAQKVNINLVFGVLGVLIAFPFVASLISYIIRAVADPSDTVVAQYFFFAVLVFVSLVYGIVVVVAGIRTLRSLSSVTSLQKDEGRRVLLVRVTRHVVIGGVLLLLAIVCLIIFVAVPTPNSLADYYVTSFAAEIVVFILQIFLLWLFRSRIKTGEASRRSDNFGYMFICFSEGSISVACQVVASSNRQMSDHQVPWLHLKTTWDCKARKRKRCLPMKHGQKTKLSCCNKSKQIYTLVKAHQKYIVFVSLMYFL